MDSDTEISAVAGYLANLKRVIDGGRFSLISVDKGQDHPSKPRDYFVLTRKRPDIIHQIASISWSPVWRWNNLNHAIEWLAVFHNNNNLSATFTDIPECRNLFQELARANLPVSLELRSQAGWPQHGAFIARRWDGSYPISTDNSDDPDEEGYESFNYQQNGVNEDDMDGDIR